MKLAEALQERADLIKKIEELVRRITDNVHVQSGENPNEDPNEMIKEMIGCENRLEVLIYTNFLDIDKK